MDTRTIWAERVAITNATRRPLGNADVALAETSPTIDDPGHDDFACRSVRSSCVVLPALCTAASESGGTEISVTR